MAAVGGVGCPDAARAGDFPRGHDVRALDDGAVVVLAEGFDLALDKDLVTGDLRVDIDADDCLVIVVVGPEDLAHVRLIPGTGVEDGEPAGPGSSAGTGGRPHEDSRRGQEG